MEAALSGTTLLIDHHSSPSFIAGSLDTIRRAVEEVGLRSVLCYEVTDRNGTAGRDAGLAENGALPRRAAHAADPRHGRRPRQLHAVGRSHGGAGRAGRRTTGTSLHVHVAEDRVDVEDCAARYGTSLLRAVRPPPAC